MSESARRTPSVPPLYDAVLDDERSAVRPRTPRPSQRPSVSEQLRGDRLERKVRLAIILQDTLPATDSRARLLRVAIVRRDEALLDGLLKELRGPTTEPPVTEPPPTSPSARLGDTLPPETRRPEQLEDELAAGNDRFRTLLPPPPDDE